MSALVAGYCPMGCGDTLFLGEGGFVTCSSLQCDNPTAVSDLLDDGETQHIVQIDETEFTVRHPLRERLGDEQLMQCELHRWIANQPGPPARPGRYRVVWTGEPDDSTWALIRLNAGGAS